MNQTQPDSTERAELARLLPPPAQRDLPSDRRQQLQEFVMTQIHQDLRTAERAQRRSPKRRLVFLTSGMAGAAALAAAVVAISQGGVGGTDTVAAANGSTNGSTTATVETVELSGQQILLAAATVAEQAPASSGTYWHVKVVSTYGTNGTPNQYEYWTSRDGQTWFRGGKTAGAVVKLATAVPFRVGGVAVTLHQLQSLPTTPDALKAWITDAVKNGNVRTSAGKLNASQQEQAVFQGLISLVSQLPAPSNVRAAAFKAIATYPNVKSTGPVNGGKGLLISLPAGGAPARLVIDPATSQIRQTNWFVTADGAEASFAGPQADTSSYTLLAEWTSERPQ